jgi:hypothetical protein
MNTEEKESLIKEIVERELTMFLATPNEGGTSICQTRPQTFRVMRWMSHCTHEEVLLKSYLQDLKNAEDAGRNLMIEKYARMDERIPAISQSPLLDEVTDAEIKFLNEASARYPHAVNVNSDETFRRYFRCELETLSEQTLTLYAEEMRSAQKEGRNPAIERYDRLWKRLGEESLEAYEQKLAAKA